MPVQTGQDVGAAGTRRRRGPAPSIGLLDRLLVRDRAYRHIPPARETVLDCGTLDHVPGRMGWGTYCFEEGGSIVLLLRGGGWYHEGTSAYRLAPGDAFLRHPGREHRTVPDADGQWFEFFLHFPRAAWQAAAAAGIFRDAGPVWHPGVHDDILLRMVAIRERMRDPLGWSNLAIIAGMLAAVADLRACHDHRDSAVADPLAEGEVLLSSNLDRILPVRAVAGRVGLPWETFRKLFRQRTGQSPAAYRNRLRLEHARRLLADDRLSVADVASLVGYDDAFAFSKAFRRWAGTAPSSLRRRR